MFWLVSVVRFVLKVMGSVYDADSAGARAHDHRLSRRSAGEEVNALQVVTVGYARCRKHHVAGRQLFDGELLVDIFDAHLFGPLDFSIVSGFQTTLHVAPDATQRGSGQDSFGSATDAHQKINA